MKYLVFILLLAVVSCSKNTDQPAVKVNSTAFFTDADLTIDSIQTKPVYSGSNSSTQFNVYISAMSKNVKRLELYTTAGLNRWFSDTAKVGVNAWYDHVSDYTPGKTYVVKINKADGSVTATSIITVK